MKKLICLGPAYEEWKRAWKHRPEEFEKEQDRRAKIFMRKIRFVIPCKWFDLHWDRGEDKDAPFFGRYPSGKNEFTYYFWRFEIRIYHKEKK